MIKKTFKTPLYGTKFTVILYDKDADIENFFKGATFDNSFADCDGALINFKDEIYVTFSTEKKGYPTVGIIAHESKHLVNKIFIDIHHPLCRYQDEPECYLLGWIVNRIYEMKPKL